MRAGWLTIACVFGIYLAPPFLRAHSNPTEFDIENAKKALRDIGADISGSSRRCAGCHEPNLVKLSQWISRAVTTVWTCDIFDRSNRSFQQSPNERAQAARNAINCLRSDPNDEQSPFTSEKLGLFAAGAHTTDFSTLFQRAYPDGTWQGRYQQFVTQVGMPKNSNLLQASDWKNIKEWMLHAEGPAPFLEDLLGGPIATPQVCRASISNDLKNYLIAKQKLSWATRNAQAGIKMFACDEGTVDAKDCFKQVKQDNTPAYPDSSRLRESKYWAVDFPQQRMIYLTNLGWQPAFWTRSSPDGRFVGNGFSGNGSQLRGGWNGRMTDLAYDLNPAIGRKDIPVLADYDPTFFPDNSGFLFQGFRNGFCNLSILKDPATRQISFVEPGCAMQDGVSLYQSVGASLNGADYFAVSGSFESDRGMRVGVVPPTWLKKSYLNVNRIIHNGNSFQVKTKQTAWTPFQGDYQLSPSTELLSSRVSGVVNGSFVQLGYKIERLSLNPDALSDEDAIKRQELGQICIDGGKGTFSYDERFFVTYNTVREADYLKFGFRDAMDPNFRALIGSHNVFLTDLFSGETHRITRMGPNQHAKFPHFRSDGWLYFMVYDGNVGGYWMYATDAALRYPRIVNAK